MTSETKVTKMTIVTSNTSLTNLESFPPPVSETDQKFVENLAKNLSKIKVRRNSLPDALHSFKEQHQSRQKTKLREKIIEGKRNMQEYEEKKEKMFLEGEKEMWESGDWRDHVKDLNCSFSKLPPINRGKKIAGKGQAFVVE